MPVAISRVPAYMICLEAAREKRCDLSFNTVKQLFPRLQVSTATDYNDIDLSDSNIVHPIAQVHIKTRVEVDPVHINAPGAIGCALSHILLWRSILERNEPAVIIEDDQLLDNDSIVRLRRHYASIPDDAHFAALVWNPLLARRGRVLDGDWTRISDRNDLVGTMMYWIHPVGASILLKNALPIVTHVDRYVSYVAAADTNFVALMQNDRIMKLLPRGSTTLGSAHTHLMIKSWLPENNAVYITVAAVLLVLLITVIVLAIRLSRQKRTQS